MVKTKVIIHLIPMGTQSQNIEEYIKDKDAQYLPHYVVGMKESIFDIYNYTSTSGRKFNISTYSR